jgi:hypothetical protein
MCVQGDRMRSGSTLSRGRRRAVTLTICCDQITSGPGKRLSPSRRLCHEHLAFTPGTSGISTQFLPHRVGPQRVIACCTSVFRLRNHRRTARHRVHNRSEPEFATTIVGTRKDLLSASPWVACWRNSWESSCDMWEVVIDWRSQPVSSTL